MGIIIRLLYGSLPCIPALTYRRDHFCFPGRSYFADKDKVNFAASHCIHEIVSPLSDWKGERTLVANHYHS